MNPLNLIPGFAEAKTAVYIVIGVAVLTVASVAFWHYNGVITQLETEKSNNVKLKDAVDTQGKTIDAAVDTIDNWKKSQQALTESIAEMNKANQAAQQYKEKLDAIFSKHDFTDLSLKQPNAIEIRINHGTEHVMGLLTCITSADDKDCEHTAGPTAGKSFVAKAAANPNTTSKVESHH